MQANIAPVPADKLDEELTEGKNWQSAFQVQQLSQKYWLLLAHK